MMYDGDRVAQLAREIIESVEGGEREVARLIGVHKTVVYDIKRGDPVGEKTLRKFAALAKNPAPILVAAGYATEDEVFWQEFEADTSLYARSRNLNPAQLQVFKGQIKTLIDTVLGDHVPPEPGKEEPAQ